MDTPITPVADAKPVPAGPAAAQAAVERYLAGKGIKPTADAEQRSATVSPETQPVNSTAAPTSEIDAPKPGTPEAKTFATVIQQSKRIRELEAQVKSAATAQPDALVIQEARTLWEKDPLAALTKVFTGDPLELADRILRASVNGNVEPAAEAPTEPKSEVERQVADLTKKLADREAAEKAAAEKQAGETVRKSADDQINGIMAKLDQAAHPLSMRPENRSVAIAIANAAVIELAKQQGIPMETNDPEVIAQLYRDGFAVAETQLREIGKRFMLEASPVPGKPAEQPASPKVAQIPARSTPKPAATIAPTPKVMTVEQAKRAAVEQIVAMARGAQR